MFHQGYSFIRSCLSRILCHIYLESRSSSVYSPKRSNTAETEGTVEILQDQMEQVSAANSIECFFFYYRLAAAPLLKV